jgi:hypothetical protein
MLGSMTPEEFKNALNIDSNNVTAKVQMHVHSHTCTKYQRKDISETTSLRVYCDSRRFYTDAEESSVCKQVQSGHLFCD